LPRLFIILTTPPRPPTGYPPSYLEQQLQPGQGLFFFRFDLCPRQGKMLPCPVNPQEFRCSTCCGMRGSPHGFPRPSFTLASPLFRSPPFLNTCHPGPSLSRVGCRPGRFKLISFPLHTRCVLSPPGSVDLFEYLAPPPAPPQHPSLPSTFDSCTALVKSDPTC